MTRSCGRMVPTKPFRSNSKLRNAKPTEVSNNLVYCSTPPPSLINLDKDMALSASATCLDTCSDQPNSLQGYGAVFLLFVTFFCGCNLPHPPAPLIVVCFLSFLLQIAHDPHMSILAIKHD